MKLGFGTLATLGTVGSMLVAVACGRSETSGQTSSEAAVVAIADASQASPSDLVAPAPAKASGKRIGLAFAVNMFGELEPCG